MGCFEWCDLTTRLHCPQCKAPLELQGWQTKSYLCEMLTLKQGEGPPPDRRFRFHGEPEDDGPPEPCPPLPAVLEMCNSCEECDAFIEAVGLIDPTDGTWRWTALDHYYSGVRSDVPVPVLDPATVETHADLSREDHAVLYRECRGRRVVEFGAGGSTEYLARFVTELHTFETDEAWAEKAMRAVARSTTPVYVHSGSEQALIDRVASRLVAAFPVAEMRRVESDVHFVDGLCRLRAPWVRAVLEQRLNGAFPDLRTILVHDTRRAEPLASLQFLLTWPMSSVIRSLEFEGNLLIIRLRKEPVKYENWNETEPEGRKGFLR